MTNPFTFCTWCNEIMSTSDAYGDTCRSCRNDRLEERAGGSAMENDPD